MEVDLRGFQRQAAARADGHGTDLSAPEATRTARSDKVKRKTEKGERQNRSAKEGRTNGRRNEEEGTTCGQKLVNDKRISVIATGAVATGAQSLFATIRGKKPVVTGVATTPVDGAQKNAVVLFGDAPHILLPFGNYAKNVLHAKTAAVIYPNAVGVADAGQVIAAGLKAAGINTKQVGYTQGQTDLTAPLTAAGATTADFIAPYGTATDCANQAKSMQQLGITDSPRS